MIRTLTICVITLLTFGSGLAQDKTKDEVLQLIADDTCLCIKNDTVSFAKDRSMQQKQLALGLCLLDSYNKRKKESAELADKGMDEFEAIGEEVGMKMASTCAMDFMSLFSEEQLIEFIEDDEDDNGAYGEFGDIPPPPPAPRNETDLNIEGQLKSLNNEAISFIELEDSYGKKHMLIVSEQFDGYQLLKKSNIDKDFRVFFKEVYYFDLSERRYVKKKVIKYLERLKD